MARFGSVLSAMVTPFAADGSLDVDAAQTLARWLVANGNDGLVVAGTTGESATLTHDEQIELVTAVREAIPDHSLIAGAGSNDTRAAVELTRRATEAGADGILQVTPYYNRPSQAGIGVHFRACAQATDLPMVIYDIPVRTGRKISHALFHELFELENIVAIKDAAGSPADTAELLAEAPERIEVYPGDDSLTLPLLAVGAVGVIGVATHWVGVEAQEMIAAFAKGHVRDATRINAKLIPSWNYEASDDAPNPVPTKEIMNLLGLSVGQCRLPMGPAPADLTDRARVVLADLDRAI
jgi:4-hydroxy-tetrahydrodipicolinate synthase